MTETETLKKSAKNAGAAAAAASKAEFAKAERYTESYFDLPKLEVPSAFREWAEKGVEQAKEAYDRVKSATEETTDVIEETYATASKGVADLNLKILEAMRANVNASFDYMRDVLGVKSFSDAVELSNGYSRKQFEMMSAQAKDLTALAQKIATEAAEPIKSSVSKTFKVA